MTLGECLGKTRKLIQYYSIAGECVAMDDPTWQDHAHLARGAIDTAQKELAKRCPVLRRVCYTQHALRPLAVRPGMHHLAGHMELRAAGAGAFSLLCDGDVTAELAMYAGGDWEPVLTVTHAGRGALDVVSGALDALPAPDAEMRLTLTAESAFVVSAALYRAFPSGEDVPVYEMRRYRALPVDCGYVERVTPLDQPAARRGFYLLEDGKIGFPWEYTGAAAVLYRVTPRTIDEATAEDMVIDLPGDAAEALPYYAAAMLLTGENPRLATLFLQLYDEKVQALDGGRGRRVRNTLFGGR